VICSRVKVDVYVRGRGNSTATTEGSDGLQTLRPTVVFPSTTSMHLYIPGWASEAEPMLLSRRLHLTYDCLRCQFVRAQVCSSEGILVLSIFVIFSPSQKPWMAQYYGCRTRISLLWWLFDPRGIGTTRIHFQSYFLYFRVFVSASPCNRLQKHTNDLLCFLLASRSLSSVSLDLIVSRKQTLHCSLDVELFYS